jgi:O-antigen ligase
MHRYAMNYLRPTVFYLFLATVFLVPIALWNGTANAGLIKYLIARTSILIISGILLFDAFRSGKVVCPDKKIVLSSLCFLLYAAIISRHSQFPDWISYGDTCLSILLFFEVYIFLDGRRDHTALFIVWQITALIVQLYYLLQLAGKDFVVWTPSELVGSTYVNRNALAYYLLCTYPFSLFFAVHTRKWMRILPIATLVLTLIITIISPCRGIKAVVVLSLPLMYCYFRKRFRIFKRGKIVCTATWIFFLLLFLGIMYLLLHIFSSGYGYINIFSHNRVLIWGEILPVIGKNCWFGYGPGTFAKVFSRYRTQIIGYAFPFKDPLLNTHNEILELTFEYGAIGVLLLGLFLAACVCCRLNFRKRDHYHNDLLFFSGLALVGSFLIAQLVDISHFIFCTYFSWISLAIFTRQNRLPNIKEIKIRWGKLLVFPILVLWWLFSLYPINRYINNFRSDAYVQRTIRCIDSNKASDSVFQLIEKALMYNPENVHAYFQRAYISTLKGNLSAALDDYERIEHFNPYYQNLHFNKGVIFYRRHDYQNAIAMFSEEARLYPLFLEGIYYLAGSYYATAQFEQSLAWCKHLVAMEPGNVNFINLYNEVVARKNGWANQP